MGPNQEASLPEITLTPVDVLRAIIILQVAGGVGSVKCRPFTSGGNFDRRSLRGSAVNRVAFSRGTFVSNQPGRKAISVDNKRMNAWRLLGDGIRLARSASHLVTPN